MQILLADTNILQYGVKKNYAKPIAEMLEGLAFDYETSISAFTTFEVYRGLAKEKIAPVKKLVSWFASPVEVDLRTFKIAAALTTCYRSHEATKTFVDRYSEGDTIIAASALRVGAHILTANGNDFPRPFFNEYLNTVIQSDSRPIAITLQILVPDIRYFNDFARECYQ